MAVNLQCFGFGSARIDRELVTAGSIETPTNIQVDGEVYETQREIANAANTVVYNDELSTFNYLWIASDYNTRVVFADTGGNSFSMTLRGTGVSKKYGVPIQLGADETVNAATTINSVTVFNSSGNTAKVSILVVK